MKLRSASRLLIEGPFIAVLPGLAMAIGLNEAIVLQQLHFLLQDPEKGKIIDGTHYIYNTYKEWGKVFLFWSVPTIKRIFLGLEKAGLVDSIKPEQSDLNQRKYYTIAYGRLEKLSRSSGALHRREQRDSSLSAPSDQIDPGADQSDPLLYRQRFTQKNNPPTPGTRSGGNPSFPGKKRGSPNGGDGTAPSAATKPRPSWAFKAAARPEAERFLSLINIQEFPASGRQPLARSFVHACESGKITPHRLELINAVKARVRQTARPEELVQSFEAIVSDAREAAQERLDEIEQALCPVVSAPGALLASMAAANNHVVSLSPEEVFGTGVSLPFPVWMLALLYVKKGVALSVWQERLIPKITDELMQDAGVLPFLQQINLSLDLLGVDANAVETTRSKYFNDLREEHTVLMGFLDVDELRVRLNTNGKPEAV